tara:strand:+ start:330 stop:602 length:273 start_codon:yes stop_codon:yes gene_type:complete
MDPSIHYPYGIPFYLDIRMIFFTIINNSQDILSIYFYIDYKKDKLASIVLPFEKRKYNFPEKSEIIIQSLYKEKDICYIKIQKDWTYIYP